MLRCEGPLGSVVMTGTGCKKMAVSRIRDLWSLDLSILSVAFVPFG